jgi:hypothetical protein
MFVMFLVLIKVLAGGETEVRMLVAEETYPTYRRCVASMMVQYEAVTKALANEPDAHAAVGCKENEGRNAQSPQR